MLRYDLVEVVREHALTARPPEAALAWVARSVGRGARVIGVRPLTGGTSSALHAIDVAVRDGTRHELVLRRYVLAEWLAAEPDLAEHEARVLKLLGTAGLAAPRLVAVDACGDQVDVPAVLMTRLPGSVERGPARLDEFLRRLAEPLPPIHAVALPTDVHIRGYDPYYADDELQPPPGTKRGAMWERAIGVHHGPPPDHDVCFIHRDYHPGNVLWDGGAVSGVVDWAVASRGAPEADVGHCRWTLAWRIGPDAAERFLQIWRSLSGRSEYHPYWDIVATVGAMPEHRHASPAERRASEQFTARAVARLR